MGGVFITVDAKAHFLDGVSLSSIFSFSQNDVQYTSIVFRRDDESKDITET